MILIECNGRVEASIETVWEVVRQAEQLPAWLARVRRAEVLSGEGFGRRQRIEYAGGGPLDAEVISYAEPTLLSWRERAEGSGARAKARTEMHVDLETDGDGTRVRLTMVRWPAGRWSAALLRLRVRRLRAGLEDSLAELADLVEGRQPVAA